MARCEMTVHVDAPADRTFEVFSDLRRAPERIPDIISLEVLSEGPVGVGTRFRETRKVFGKEATEEMEVVAYEPGRVYAVECESCGARYRSEFTFRGGASGGTDVEMSMRVTPLSMMAKLMSPLAGMAMGSMKKAIGRDLEALKAVAEGEAVSTGG